MKFLVIAALLFGVGFYLLIPSPSVVSPIPDTPQKQEKTSKDPDVLDQKISLAIGIDLINYSLYVVDFTSNFVYEKNAAQIFTAASVNKMPILAAVYHGANTGTIDLDRVITVQKNDIQDFGTGSIRYKGAGSTYSVKTLAKLMISQSDNTAAYILSNHVVGLDKLQAYTTTLGLSQTDIANNKTSNRDMAILFRALYEKTITNDAYTQEMLSFLKDTDFENRLPANLPKHVSTYHKIGTEVRNIHDVGIVTDGSLAYYIGVFISDVTDEAKTEAKIAEISKIVYDFML